MLGSHTEEVWGVGGSGPSAFSLTCTENHRKNLLSIIYIYKKCTIAGKSKYALNVFLEILSEVNKKQNYIKIYKINIHGFSYCTLTTGCYSNITVQVFTVLYYFIDTN